MNFTPLADKVVVRREASATQTAGGIYIPDGAAEKAEQGIALAVGPGKRHPVTGELIAISVAVNDCVLFSKNAGQTTKINGEELLILREEEILGIVR
ncbi:MAG TPA: co-chaperone GroES [Methanosarcina sp.]|nr:co-chaperone GroES [Methanosarcina sp.]